MTIEMINGDNYWNELRLWADSYDDAMLTKNGNQSRINKAAIIPDGLEAFIDQLESAQKLAAKGMKNLFKHSGFRDFQLRSPGIGEHILARFLGHLGDPVVAYPHHHEETPNGQSKRVLVRDEPYYRTLHQLWAYCKVGDASKKRKKGMTQEDAMKIGKPLLRSILYVMVQSAIKEPGRSIEMWRECGHFGDGEANWYYRSVYENRRTKTKDRIDSEGKAWTNGHADTDAQRIVAKEILRNLWIEARKLHGLEILTKE